MLHFVEVILKDVFEQGRNFKWAKPSRCPRCGYYNVWGHGFVERFFDHFPSPLLMKRFRCNHCGCIICCRPASHFPRIQSTFESIKTNLAYRIAHGRWLTGIPPSRLRHWLANLKCKVLAHFGMVHIRDLLAGYNELLALGHIPVSCSV